MVFLCLMSFIKRLCAEIIMALLKLSIVNLDCYNFTAKMRVKLYLFNGKTTMLHRNVLSMCIAVIVIRQAYIVSIIIAFNTTSKEINLKHAHENVMISFWLGFNLKDFILHCNIVLKEYYLSNKYGN